jgi:hypothetical protein
MKKKPASEYQCAGRGTAKKSRKSNRSAASAAVLQLAARDGRKPLRNVDWFAASHPEDAETAFLVLPPYQDATSFRVD